MHLLKPALLCLTSHCRLFVFSVDVLLHGNDASRYATPKLVLRFADMVKKLGPQERLVNFFEAICTVQGRAVKANQEMVLNDLC